MEMVVYNGRCCECNNDTEVVDFDGAPLCSDCHNNVPPLGAECPCDCDRCELDREYEWRWAHSEGPIMVGGGSARRALHL